jgi:hydroxyacylglutathione hydrolase
VLVVGDAIRNFNPANWEVGLIDGPDIFSVDPDLNRESIRKLAALDPLVCCFGHGPVLTDPDVLHAFVERLPLPIHTEN